MGFQFKQFVVEHDQCALKVGTDGVLLGSWVSVHSSKRILDVGAGSGLISLMMAQRCDHSCLIDAIEIEPHAAKQASENFIRSPWGSQLTLYEGDFVTYPFGPVRYDLIISNPPYFNNSLRSERSKKALARHDDSLSLEQMIEKSTSLLTPLGRIALIIPFERYSNLLEILAQFELNVTSELFVRGTPSGDYKRVLVECSKRSIDFSTRQEMFIEHSRHHYSEEYQQLTKEYYL